MPVQHVELVQRHPVDEALDVFRRLEMPRRVQHESAPREARRIGDPQRGHIDGQPCMGSAVMSCHNVTAP